MPYHAQNDRYERMTYNRCGRSGVRLPAISLGLWNNFGGNTSFEKARAMVLRAFDGGVTHFDLANNYGPPGGSAEENFGAILQKDLAPYRDELMISTKAGYPMWPGPYGDYGSRKHLLASLDQSLDRMGLDYVDIFYHHRADAKTPLEETMGALATAVHQGKALYVGVSSYSASRTAKAAALLGEMGVPLFIHQPSYSLLNRWIEAELLDELEKQGAGCIAFSPLAQGLLTSKYLGGIPEDSRAETASHFFRRESYLTEENLSRVRALTKIAEGRGQTLPQMALAWCLRDPRVTSVLIGAGRPEQIGENLGALASPEFSEDELSEIDKYAREGGVNLWAPSSNVE
ncbi:MAG: L-glyceraldehyde 3-phosphate reductase [Spirochaetota bacterium]